MVARHRPGAGPPKATGEGITGATCLFAIYDPVAGDCCIARAGHPGPAVVDPDGPVLFPDVPVSPPLGLGAACRSRPPNCTCPRAPGSSCTPTGSSKTATADIDIGLELLSGALAHPGQTPEQACQAVLDALLPDRPADDIALLVARTRRLDPDRVADWDVPSDPAVRRPRSAPPAPAGWKPGGWTTIAFTTELILSELVTNAIRYGSEPIRLRLLYDRDSLICEVADGSSTSPHLRRAATTDEGGRGLFLVAQFARRWGTRYTDRGKVIWSEQSLDASEAGLDDVMGDILLDQWDEPTS